MRISAGIVVFPEFDYDNAEQAASRFARLRKADFQL